MDGYEIVDDGFIGKIYDNNQRLGQYISFNAFEGGEHGVNISDKVKLIKESEDSDKVTIKLKDGENAKISWIEIFYNQSVRANIGETEWAKYQNGQEVTAHNTATGQLPGLGPTGPKETGTGDRTGQKKVEADKKYNSQDHIQVIGMSDKVSRILNWNIGLTNDNGFVGSTALNDVLQQDSANGGKHYITPDQTHSFEIKDDDNNPIPTSAYTITFYDENGNVATGDTNAVRFTVEFNDTIGSSYKHLSITYSTTADVEGVPNGHTAHFDNKYQYGSQEKTTKGLEFERDDPHDVKNIKLSINKTWDDRNNKFNTRPATFKVQIWRAEVDENGNCPAANDELAWTRIPEAELANSAEYEISSSHQGAYLLGEFPQWYVKEPGEVIVRYCYKVVEVPDDSGYVLTHVSPPFIAEYDNTFDLKNKKELDVIKLAVDKDGKPINSADLSTVPKVKVDIDGTPTDCYIFGWEIYFKEGHDNYTDTLPTGAKYINIGPDYATKVIYDDFGNSWGIEDWNMTISQNNDKLSIRITDSRVKSVRYFTAIPTDKIADALDPDRKLINKVKDNADDKEYTGTLNVTNDAPDDTQHLKKEAIPDKHRVGVIHYSLDVNPTGKKMSNEDYITITDAVQIDADSSHENDLKFALDSIAVYPCDENGQVDKSHPIENYSYTVDYDYEDSTNLSFSDMKDGKMNNNAIKYWVVNGWEHGKNITITVPKNPDYTKDQSNLNLVIFKTDNPNTDNIATGNDVSSQSFSNYDSNGNATITLKVPDDATEIVVTSGFEELDATTPISGFNIAENGVTATSGGSPLTVSHKGDNASDSGYQYRYWEITGWNVGDTVELNAVLNPVFMPIFETNPNTHFDQIRYSIYGNTYNVNNFYYPSPIEKNDVYDFKDSKTWTVTVPEGAQHLFVFSKYINKSDYKVRNYSSIGGLTGVSKSDPVPALLNVDVPDQQHVRVEYTYRVSGTKTTDKIFLTNTASFEADNGSGWDRANHNQLTVKSSGASSSTNTNPNIYKADVNNYSLNTLEASFKVAKWDETNGCWVYASEVKDITIDDQPVRKFVFPTENVDNYLETVSGGEHYAPANAAVLKFAKTDDPSIPSNETVHEFKLDDEALYKFVEIESPQNYRQVNASGSLEDNSEFVFYYAYNGYTGSTPDDAMANGKSKIRNISAGNNINIPNSQFISISAQKSFTGTGIPITAEVELGLYYSTSRNGKNLTAVTADMVDDSNFRNPKTLTYNKTGNAPDVTWTGLPSGINGSPVYYFVKEESCEYGGETYKRDRADDKLKRETDGEACPFQPVYTRNGTNKDDTVIEVNNSQGIAVKKIWQKSDGTLIPNPNLSIQYEVYGIKGSTRTLYYSDTLSLANGFQQILPQEIDEKKLSDYDTFEVVELNKPEGWTTSTTRKLENGTGTLEIINTQEVVETTTNISVKKVWDMNGSTQTHPDRVNVKLIQSLYSIALGEVKETDGVATPDFGECISAAEQTLNEANSWEFTWNDLPKKDGEEQPYYYYVIETSNYPGYTVSYSNNGTLTTITNTFKKVDLKVSKLWAGDDNKDHSGETIKFVIKRSTNPDDVPNNGTTIGEEQEIFVPEKTLAVIASPSEVYEGASVDLSAKFGNDDVTDSAVFYVNDSEIPGHTFVPDSTGTYTVKAKYLGKESQGITVTVNEKQLTIAPETETIYEGHSITFASEYGDAPVDAVYTVNPTDAAVNGNEITFNAPGTYEVTATYDNKTATANITVNPVTLTITPSDEQNITAGDKVTFSAALSDGSSTDGIKYYVSKDGGTPTEASGNEIKFSDPGTYKVTAEVNGIESNEVTVNVEESGDAPVVYTINAKGDINVADLIGSHSVNDIVAYKLTFQDKNGTSVALSYGDWGHGYYYCNGSSLDDSNSVLLTFDNGEPHKSVVTFHDNDNNVTYPVQMTIYFTAPTPNPSPAPRFNSNMKNGQTFGTYQAAAPTLTSARSKRPLRGGNITKTVGAEALENEVTELFFNTNVSDIIELGAGKTPSTKMNVSIVGGKVKLKANKQGAGDTDSEWIKTINGLPATDENNNPYYYWIEEVNVAQDYSASYTDNNVDAVNTNGNAEITITNTKKDDTGVELPISGGSGLNTIYTIGAVLLMMSGAGYTMYRRRRWYDE
ncbi:MAG: Cna B-type domain-containing protein [Ruminococcus sp.]|nr:Cna B-type domain-containing protein [Ruminococcus sp.]